jgi:arabinofuranosyltransferase
VINQESWKPQNAVQKTALILILIGGSIGLFWGWRLFWFLTDDAYIAFRYVSNSMLGYGYTWNLPPFSPVEGYTSFLWVLLLEFVWQITGIEPPDSANILSLLFAFGTMVLCVLMLLKMNLSPKLDRVRLMLLVLFLTGVLTNRTFLAWTSSGLETAMFNFFLTSWVFCALFLHSGNDQWLAWLAITAVFTTLSRPDGLLLVGATLFLALVIFGLRWRNGRFQFRSLLILSPFLIIITHFLWRKQKYNAWLPNTHAAKSVVLWWPESGWRYALSFTIEYALWIWLGLVGLFLIVFLLRWRQHKVPDWQIITSIPYSLVGLVVVGTLLAHFAYYTLIIGGDFMEYRVYSQWVPFIFLSTIWLLNTLHTKPWQAIVFLLLFIAASLPIPWQHWAATRHLTSRQNTYEMYVPVADRFPAWTRPYVAPFDTLQEWLIQRRVGLRHQEHKAFIQFQQTFYPSRERGALLSPDNRAVAIVGPVGLPAWVMPTINIIDTYGLNDTVVAHNPVDPSLPRRMAHDRYPPDGYTECYQPNLKLVTDNKFVIANRTLSDADVAACETKAWPPSIGDETGTTNLKIDSENAPAVDAYLWQIWPENPLYLSYQPPEIDATHTNQAFLVAFQAYQGSGCVIVPPTDYLFGFLPAADRPSLTEVQALFPWANLVTEELAESAFAYNLGYAAPVSSMAPMPEQPLSAKWQNGLELIGYNVPRNTYQPGETIPLTLYLHVQDSIPVNETIAVHLLGEAFNSATNGPLWTQADGNPCGDLYPMDVWPAGSTIIGKMILPLPFDTPSGEYQLSTLLYNWQTGEPVPLTNGEERITLLSILIEPQ